MKYKKNRNEQYLNNKVNKYSIRKLKAGAAAVMIGSFLFFGVSELSEAAEIETAETPDETEVETEPAEEPPAETSETVTEEAVEPAEETPIEDDSAIEIEEAELANDKINAKQTIDQLVNLTNDVKSSYKIQIEMAADSATVYSIAASAQNENMQATQAEAEEAAQTEAEKTAEETVEEVTEEAPQTEAEKTAEETVEEVTEEAPQAEAEEPTQEESEEIIQEKHEETDSKAEKKEEETFEEEPEEVPQAEAEEPTQEESEEVTQEKSEETDSKAEKKEEETVEEDAEEAPQAEAEEPAQEKSKEVNQEKAEVTDSESEAAVQGEPEKQSVAKSKVVSKTVSEPAKFEAKIAASFDESSNLKELEDSVSKTLEEEFEIDNPSELLKDLNVQLDEITAEELTYLLLKTASESNNMYEVKAKEEEILTSEETMYINKKQLRTLSALYDIPMTTLMATSIETDSGYTFPADSKYAYLLRDLKYDASVVDEDTGLRYAGLNQVTNIHSDSNQIDLQLTKWLALAGDFRNGGRVNLSFSQPDFYNNIESITLSGVTMTANPEQSNWSTAVSPSSVKSGLIGSVTNHPVIITLRDGQTMQSLGFDDNHPVYVLHTWTTNTGEVALESIDNSFIRTTVKTDAENSIKTNFTAGKVRNTMTYNEADNAIRSVHTFKPDENFLQTNYDWVVYIKEQIPQGLLPYIDTNNIQLFVSDNDGNKISENRVVNVSIDENGLVDTSRVPSLSLINNADNVAHFDAVRGNLDRNVFFGTLGQSRSFTLSYGLKDGVTLEKISADLNEKTDDARLDFYSWMEEDYLDSGRVLSSRTDNGAATRPLEGSFATSYLDFYDYDNDGIPDITDDNPTEEDIITQDVTVEFINGPSQTVHLTPVNTKGERGTTIIVPAGEAITNVKVEQIGTDKNLIDYTFEASLNGPEHLSAAADVSRLPKMDDYVRSYDFSTDTVTFTYDPIPELVNGDKSTADKIKYNAEATIAARESDYSGNHIVSTPGNFMIQHFTNPEGSRLSYRIPIAVKDDIKNFVATFTPDLGPEGVNDADWSLSDIKWALRTSTDNPNGRYHMGDFGASMGYATSVLPEGYNVSIVDNQLIIIADKMEANTGFWLEFNVPVPTQVSEDSRTLTSKQVMANNTRFTLSGVITGDIVKDTDVYEAESNQIVKEFGQSVTENEILNQVTVPNYNEDENYTVSVNDLDNLPDGQVAGDYSVSVTVTYPDGSTDTLDVPVTILPDNIGPAIESADIVGIEGQPITPQTVTVTDNSNESIAPVVKGLPDGLAYNSETGNIEGTIEPNVIEWLPEQESTDFTVVITAEDSTGNGAEQQIKVTVQRDTDGDGEPDVIDSDDDNDGFTDEEEIAAGTDPKDPSDYPDTVNPGITPVDDQTVVEGDPITPILVEVDEPSTITVNGLPEGVIFNSDTNEITGTPVVEWNGDEEIRDFEVTITATDESDNTSTETVIITVQRDTDGDGDPDVIDSDDDNDGFPDEEEIAAGTDPKNPTDQPDVTAPVITPINDQTIVEGTPVTPIVIEVDEPVTVDVSELPEGLVFNPDTNEITGTPIVEWDSDEEVKDFEIVIKATDESGNSSTETVIITVQRDTDGDGNPDVTDPDDDNDGFTDEEEIAAGTDPKDPTDQPDVTNPGITPIDDQTIVEGNSISPIVIEVDEPSTITVEGLPEGVTFNPDTNSITGTPVIEWEGDEETRDFEVTVTATDDSGNTSTETVIISVQRDTDGDGNPDVTDPDDDNDGFTDEEEITAGTNPKDPSDYPDGTAPVITPIDNQTIVEGNPIASIVIEVDEAVTIDVSELPEGLVFNPDTNEITGTPIIDWEGNEEVRDIEIVITVTDESGNTSTETVVISVQRDTDGDGDPDVTDPDDDNDGFTDEEEIAAGTDPKDPTDQPDVTAPVITPIDDQTIVEGNPIAPIVIEVDEPVTVDVSELPDGVVFHPDTNEITGTPIIDWDRNEEIHDIEIVITVTDNSGNTTTETVVISVQRDTDGDGDPDVTDPDDDNDGFTDEQEIAAGTDPKDSNHYPESENNDSDAGTIINQDDNHIDSPAVNPVGTDNHAVTGHGDPGETIIVTLPSGENLQTTVNDQGDWMVYLPDKVQLHAGDIITAVAVDADGITSIRSSVIVGEKQQITGKDLNARDDSIAEKLPDTGEANSNTTTVFGSFFLALGSLLLFKRRKRKDEEETE